MSFKKTSKMKKNAPHKQKDYPEGVHKTAVRMVEDTVKDPTEPHRKAVKTQEAEVRDVQSREFCSFATRGGKYEVWRGEFYINVERDEIYINVKKGEVYINEMKKVEEDGVAVKHVLAEDMPRPLSHAKQNVMMHGDDFNEEEMLVKYCVEIVAVNYVEVEDMLRPLSLTKDIVMMRSCDYDNTEREEVLAELTEQHEVLPLTQRQMKYEVAEEKGVAKYIVRIELKDKEDKLGRRSENSCKMQRTRIFQLLSWGCIGWQQAPPIVF